MTTAIRFRDLQATNPVSGDMRKNLTLGCTEIYNGSGWIPVVGPGWEHKETLAESVAHVADIVAMSIEEDYANNVTIQDAYAEWRTSTEKFLVVLAIAEK